MTVTFCGHSHFCRTKQLQAQMMEVLEKEIGDRQADLLLGGYGDFDAFAYDCCKSYQKNHEGVSLVFVTPYMTESHLKKVKEMMTSKIYDTVLYPPLEQVPLRFAISKRNEWMIEQSDVIITFVRHSYGGAYKSLLYAQRKKKKMIHLAQEE